MVIAHASHLSPHIAGHRGGEEVTTSSRRHTKAELGVIIVHHDSEEALLRLRRSNPHMATRVVHPTMVHRQSTVL